MAHRLPNCATLTLYYVNSSTISIVTVVLRARPSSQGASESGRLYSLIDKRPATKVDLVWSRDDPIIAFSARHIILRDETCLLSRCVICLGCHEQVYLQIVSIVASVFAKHQSAHVHSIQSPSH